MSDETITPWQGDWKRRLSIKLESLGHPSLDAFLVANPGMGYVDLAEALGEARVAPMQLYGEQIRSAARDQRLRSAAVDCLSRLLVQHIKRGWGNGRHFPLRVASAFGDWKYTIREFASRDDLLNQKVNSVIEAIKASEPPNGWVPTSGEDPILQDAFRIGWPNE